MDKMLETNELVSALVDGELRGDAFVRAIEVLESDTRTRAVWHDYHLIGDVLRSGELAANLSSAGFVSRIQQHLAMESITVAKPVAVDSVALGNIVFKAAEASGDRHEAANQSSFRWKLVAGVASLAAVVAVVWNVAAPQLPGTARGELVQAPQTLSQEVVAAGVGSVMIRDPRLDELLAAHRQAGGSSALQMPSGFLRNATFEGPAR